MTSIFEQRGNPARNLFRLWEQIIDTNGGQSAAYGSAYSRSSTIHRLGSHKDVIAYGHLNLTRKGRFRIMRMHGHKQRLWVSRGTFLGFRHWRGSYNWFVDFQDPQYWQSLWSIEGWSNPLPYVTERIICPLGWSIPDLWLELEPHVPTHGEPPWQIVPSPNQRDISDPWGARTALSASQRRAWEKFVTLRADRYERLRREELGLLSPSRQVSVRTPSVVSNGTKFEGEEAVHKITALLNVHQPAKLSKRLEEAHS